ncbi:MAG TPA: GNAT family N-acetyltransferase [Kofleriaceae bacterium]|nr:GNAT family N-acetyltransferase [Kofleriaceae bacterium]
MESIVIRTLEERDAASWLELRMRSLREDGPAFLATHDEDARLVVADVAARLRPSDPANVTLGAFDADRLVGSAVVRRHERAKARHRGLLLAMYVAPEARRRGIGEAIVRRAIEHARAHGIEQLELAVALTSHAARRLYERLGFVRIGRLPRAQREAGGLVDEDELVLALTGPKPVGDDQLAERSPSECVPALLAIARRHAERKRPADVRAQYARDAFVAPSFVDQRAAHRLDELALAAAPEFEAVLLSPLAPLASCVAVSPSSQDRIVTTMRGSEVVSDPTNVLALECARRHAADGGDVRLCTVHQVVRAQRFAPRPGMTQHFRMFALAEAGRARADHAFEVDAFVRHLAVFSRLLDAAGARGPRIARVLAAATAAPIATRLRTRLAAELPALQIVPGELASGYYAGVRVLLDVGDANLSDTGLFDWVARLTSDARVRFVASGFGLQRLALQQ